MLPRFIRDPDGPDKETTRYFILFLFIFMWVCNFYLLKKKKKRTSDFEYENSHSKSSLSLVDLFTSWYNVNFAILYILTSLIYLAFFFFVVFFLVLLKCALNNMKYCGPQKPLICVLELHRLHGRSQVNFHSHWRLIILSIFQ